MKTLIIPICAGLLLSACKTVPQGQVIGNDMSHLSLRDKRLAQKQVQVLPSTPANATQLGTVSAQRCQAGMTGEKPEEKSLMTDIKAEAYRLGANAISNVEVSEVSSEGSGCWSLYQAKAQMLVVQ